MPDLGPLIKGLETVIKAKYDLMCETCGRMTKAREMIGKHEQATCLVCQGICPDCEQYGEDSERGLVCLECDKVWEAEP